jgi:hypothetical protein
MDIYAIETLGIKTFYHNSFTMDITTIIAPVPLIGIMEIIKNILPEKYKSYIPHLCILSGVVFTVVKVK